MNGFYVLPVLIISSIVVYFVWKYVLERKCKEVFRVGATTNEQGAQIGSLFADDISASTNPNEHGEDSSGSD
jgi:hypothetical protein